MSKCTERHLQQTGQNSYGKSYHTHIQAPTQSIISQLTAQNGITSDHSQLKPCL